MNLKTEENNFLIVITARLGSRGLIGKNYYPINSKPMFIYSVEHALNCGFKDTFVCISTNCEKVKEKTNEYFTGLDDFVYLPYNLIILDRPEEISTDTSKNEDALIHALDHYEKRGVEFNWVVNLQPTSPMRPNNLVGRCMQKIVKSYQENPNIDSLITVSKHTPFFYKNNDGLLIPEDHNPCSRPMRQQLKESDFYYHDNGSVYITRCDILREKKCRVGNFTIFEETDEYASHQVDSLHDIQSIERLMKDV